MNTDTLIRTKLQRPTIGLDILPRTRLIERLDDGKYRKLTLISAPAGYGKSILASAWQEACSCPGAWLSLDENDNDLGVFVNYFISAIQTMFPESFTETKALINGQKLPALDIVSTYFVNETASVSQPFMLVLDDYHVIFNQDIHRLIGNLIQYLPAPMHLVLITRQDPPLDITNLRAKNQVTEIRLAELRFNEEEALKYLDSKLGDSITPDLAHELFQRTEGWAVGLRLALMAWRHQVDQDRFLENFQGTNRYIMSYLVSEVLSQQSRSVQTFLLQTSILDRFSAPLCDALLVKEDSDPITSSQEIIDRLLQDNLFLIPLDNQGEWFRYHHLFQDLLRYRLSSTFSERALSQLHVQASSWLREQGFIEEALDHAFRADDMDRAAQIVATPAMARASKTPFSGTETVAGPPIDPGTATFVDGNFHMREHTVVFADDTDDPRVSGQNTVVANWNFRPAAPPVTWTGPEWGTFHIENEGGNWDGTWTGKRDENGYSIIKGVAHGSGDYAGLKGHWTFSRLSPDPAAPFDITGWILEP